MPRPDQSARLPTPTPPHPPLPTLRQWRNSRGCATLCVDLYTSRGGDLVPQPPANDSDGGVGGEANPTDNEDVTHKADDLMRLVQARTLPARLSLLASTAQGLVDDLDQLSSASQPPPR